MKRYKIIHHTAYDFSGMVQLLPHTLRLRPREGHELRIENSKLDIFPDANLRWHRDAEENSVAIATFHTATQKLTINSEIIIQQYDLAPQDFLVAEYAVDYPFSYQEEDKILLSPYITGMTGTENTSVTDWVSRLWQIGEKIQTFALLLRLNQRVYQSVAYRMRNEEGVQSPEQTLACGTGSCRDSAGLFITAARQLGFAARFVSGYIASHSPTIYSGSTHAWVEVFIPGAGWKGFDPTIGNIVGADHIAISTARLPESVPPVAGNYLGPPGTTMKVEVWVTEVA